MAPKKQAAVGNNDNTKKPLMPGRKAPGMSDEFVSELIGDLNKEHGSNIAFNLGTEDAPTQVRRWIGTGSRQLDYVVANRDNGGLPEGRIVEIQGPPGIGKSTLVALIARSTQGLGGIVVYVDTENATNPENLESMGIDVARSFVFVQSPCTEEILAVIESTILKARAMKKDIPVTVIWDSVSQSSPKAELEGDYDQNSIGLQARVLSKGMRKISNVIGGQKVLLVLVSQQRVKIGVMFGDPTTTSGGMAIPYASSVRIRLDGGSVVKDKDENTIGINLTAKTIKNKVGKPFRKCAFQLIFGYGIIEHEEIFDVLREYCAKSGAAKMEDTNITVEVSGAAAWKNFLVKDTATGEIHADVKFNKADFAAKVLDKPEYAKWVKVLMDAAYIQLGASHSTYVGADLNSDEEAKAVAIDQAEKELNAN
jgi:recombination protein RecA